MSTLAAPPVPAVQSLPLATALQRIAACAAERDRAPGFPAESVESLRAAGVLRSLADRGERRLADEIALVRAVAVADGSTSRILDGHFNGVERLELAAPSALRDAELVGVRDGALLLGVWGADPSGAEGPPAHVARGAAGELVLRGTKVFCSGAGGVQRAVVAVRDERGARRLAYVDATSCLEIDRDWYRASGLRASESHRVSFDDAPVLALLGGDDELRRQPYFARDSVRTAATWAGLAQCVFETTLTMVGGARPDASAARRIARMRIALATIDRWLEHAAHALALPPLAADPAALALECRAAISQAARLIARDAAEVCGSRALIAGGALDRARRDLDLFLLQHRLDPKLVELGYATLERADR